MEWTIKTFQELTVDELYAILQLRTDVFVVEQECPYPEVDGRDQECYHLCATEEGALVAYARILPPGLSFEEAAIGRVIVAKSHRGKGLGYPLIEKAMAFIQEELGQSRIKISAQAHLEHFYKQCGFQTVSEVYLEDGIPHQDMVWVLDVSSC